MNPDNSFFPDPPYLTDDLRQSFQKFRDLFDICSNKAQEMEELIRECNGVLCKLQDEGADNPSVYSASNLSAEDNYYTLEDFMEDIQNELPQMDYFSTPYDKGSRDDLLYRISHLSAMYSRFGYGARGKEWSKGYHRGQMDARDNLKKNKEEATEEAKWATEELVKIFERSASKSKSLAKELEDQKRYTREAVEANNTLQYKLSKAREFLSSWEDGDRINKDGVNEGTLYDTFNDYLEGKYDPRSGEWK